MQYAMSNCREETGIERWNRLESIELQAVIDRIQHVNSRTWEELKKPKKGTKPSKINKINEVVQRICRNEASVTRENSAHHTTNFLTHGAHSIQRNIAILGSPRFVSKRIWKSNKTEAQIWTSHPTPKPKKKRSNKRLIY